MLGGIGCDKIHDGNGKEPSHYRQWQGHKSEPGRVRQYRRRDSHQESSGRQPDEEGARPTLPKSFSCANDENDRQLGDKGLDEPGRLERFGRRVGNKS